MASKRHGKVSLLLPAVVLVAGGSLFAGLAYYVKTSPALDVPKEMRRTDPRPSPPGAHSDTVKVYRPSYDGNELKLHESATRAPRGVDQKVHAINSYLAELTVVPKTARAKSFTVNGSIATIDFTRDFETTYGTEDEQTIVKGLLATASQFGVKQVRLTVEGKPLETLGNLDLTGLQPVDASGLGVSPEEAPAIGGAPAKAGTRPQKS
ncbi:MAG: GerMN domain-containing protein [Fimbriimonadaceae bacterium]|nr:GerMN domain-containing protein [Fimbriimonadaceae bacterium]QYK55095.1 MAG: GerMN domain-containing protein [Fimbriimonadaceae bacterium]